MCVQTLASITVLSATWHLEMLCSLRAELFSVHPLFHSQEMGMNYLFRIWKQQKATMKDLMWEKTTSSLKLSETKQSRLRDKEIFETTWNLRTIQ